MTVHSEKDRVIIAFSKRGRDLQLTPDQAEILSLEIERQANFCEVWVNAGGTRKLLTGGSRGALVQSWDGVVNVRLDSHTNLESIPYEAARLLAAEIRAKIPEARERIRLMWSIRNPLTIGV